MSSEKGAVLCILGNNSRDILSRAGWRVNIKEVVILKETSRSMLKFEPRKSRAK